MDMEDELQTDSLQARFEAMRRRKLKAAKNPRRARSQASRDALRTKFVKQVESYVGVPYSRKYSETEAPQYLDCCNLIRRCVLDLKHDFGFTSGGTGHQAYQFDTLPIKLSGLEELKPGDLIFWTATFNDPSRSKPRKHKMVHVEVFVGGETGEATIGSRSTDPTSFKGVAHHASYRSYAERCTASHDFQLFFRSIDTWLNGDCVSRCKECNWNDANAQNVAASRKFGIFRGAASEKGGGDENAPANGNASECRDCVEEE
jgi:hypothetical protein